jgi:hypothetical protein
MDMQERPRERPFLCTWLFRRHGAEVLVQGMDIRPFTI